MTTIIGFTVMGLALVGLARLCTLAWRGMRAVVRGTRLALELHEHERELPRAMPRRERAPRRAARREPDASETCMWSPSEVES